MRREVTSILIGAIIGITFGVIGVNSREPITVRAVEEVPYEMAEVVEPAATAREITDGERDLMAAIVFAEAGSEDLEGKRYVVDVVLNRVDDPRFPEDITGVIFQPYQFWTKGLPSKFSDIPAECYEAVDLSLTEQLNTEILFFRNNHYHSFGTPVMSHNNHYFSK